MAHVSRELEQVRQARNSLQKVRLKLLQPSAAGLESGARDLQAALECLMILEPMLESRDRRGVGAEQSLRLEIAGLRRELQQVNALQASVGRFYEGWARLLSAAADDCGGNYTAGGKPGDPASSESRRLVLHG